jgi:hypothetical protein
MGKTTEEPKWSSLRIRKDFLGRLKTHCEALGQKVSTFVMRAAEKEMNSKNSE